MVPIAASSRSAISRLARSSLRDFTSDRSSSSARRDLSAPSAWILFASSRRRFRRMAAPPVRSHWRDDRSYLKTQTFRTPPSGKIRDSAGV